MMTHSVSMKLCLFSTLLATVLGCGGGTSSNMAVLKGRVSDSSGSQPQSLGGSGSISATAKVRVSRLKVDGSLELVAQGNVQSDGRYELAVPAGEKRLICESVDASGKVVASVIVESSGSGGAMTVSPMDTETSIEAAVLAKMAASGVALAECNAIDLRARINVKVAEAVKAAADADVKIRALAEAIAAAQSAKVKAYASAGINTSQSALFDAQLAAAVKLNAALDASASASASDKAYADFYSDSDAALMAMDASAKKHARAESCASVAFRAAVKARLQAGAAADPVADASLRAAASLEARAAAAAVQSLLTAGAAASATTTAAANASAMLSAQLAASTSASASAAAFAGWRTSLTGGGSVSGSVVGDVLGVNLATAVAAQTAVTATATAASVLDTTLDAATKVLVTGTGAIDINGLSQTVVSAYATFQAAVDLQLTVLAPFGGKAQLGLDVMATANGSLRLP